jgi:chromosomal replication initiation ATPase DnaA
MHESPTTVNLKSPGVSDQIAITTPAQFTRVIVESVAARHGVSVADIFSPCRLRPIVDARHEAIAEVCEARPHWSYPTVGRLFGRDHTTIMSALERLGRKVPRKCRIHHHDGMAIGRGVGEFVAALEIAWEGGAK